MANKKEIQALITLAGKIDPSLQNALLKAAGQADKLTSKLKQSGKEMSAVGTIAKGSFLGNLAADAVQRGADSLWEFGKNSLMLASDLTEVQNVVDTTFGLSANQINQWSKTALNAYGLSELQAKQYSGTMGAMLKSSGVAGDHMLVMSQNLTALAGDFASFYNKHPEEAFEKIRSGISGETEPLKELGINMSVANLEAFALSKGIKTSYNSMDQASQTMLRYNYLLEVSKDAQGDFWKTHKEAANQMRLFNTNLMQTGATLAEKVLPSFNTLVTYGNDVMTGSKELSPWIYGLGAAFTSLLVVQTVTTLYDAWKVSTFAVTLAQHGLNAALAANPIGLVIVGIGLLVAAGVYLHQNWDYIGGRLHVTWMNIKKSFADGVNTAVDYINLLIDGLNVLPGVNIAHVGKVALSYSPQSFAGFRQLDTYAAGGFANSPSIFGEAGLEAAIPIKRDSRSLGLLNQTAQMLGADQHSVLINIYGANLNDPQSVGAAVKSAIEQYFDGEVRVSYG